MKLMSDKKYLGEMSGIPIPTLYRLSSTILAAKNYTHKKMGTVWLIN